MYDYKGGMCVIKKGLAFIAFSLLMANCYSTNLDVLVYEGERQLINEHALLFSGVPDVMPADRGELDNLLLNTPVQSEITSDHIDHIYMFDVVVLSNQEAIIVELKGSIIDKVELYAFDSLELIHFDESGFEDPRRGHTYNLKLPVVKGDSIRVVLAMKSRYVSGPINIYLENTGSYEDKSLNVFSLVYVCLGGMVLLGLYNLFICVGLRDKTYLFYSLYLFSIVIGWMAVFSLLLRHFDITTIAFSLLPFYVAPIFLVLFFVRFLELSLARHKRILSLAYLVVAFNTVMCFLFPFLDNLSLYYEVLLYNSGVVLVLGLTAGIIRLIEGYKPARFFVLGFLVLALGSSVAILPGLGIRVAGLVEDYYVVTLIAQAIDILFLAVALSDKINLIRADKDLALARVRESDRKMLVMEKDVSDTLATANSALLETLEITEAQEKKRQHFLMLASHELKTPLNAMVQSVRDLEGQETLKHGVERLSILVDELTLFSQITSDDLKPVLGRMSVASFFRDFMENNAPLLEDKEISVTKNITDTLEVDNHLLSMVLKPILDNACKFCNERVAIHYSYDDDGYARWLFEDDGEGMTQDELPFLMEAFSQKSQGLTRKKEGLGLGLYIAHNSLLALNGKITFSSSKELKGACVEVVVPCKRLQQDQEKSSVIKQALIVEDNATNAMVLASILEKVGVESIVAENGQVALEVLSKNSFDMVFMDLQMPVMDGLETTEELKKRSYPAPIVAVTADTESSVRERCMDLGMSAVLYKPIRLNDVTDCMEGLGYKLS